MVRVAAQIRRLSPQTGIQICTMTTLRQGGFKRCAVRRRSMVTLDDETWNSVSLSLSIALDYFGLLGYEFEMPSRVTFRAVECVASHAGIIEQFDWQRPPSSTRRALRYPERKQKSNRDTCRHVAA